MLRCENLMAVAPHCQRHGAAGGPTPGGSLTGSECTQSSSLMPDGRITTNNAAPVTRPPTCAQYATPSCARLAASINLPDRPAADDPIGPDAKWNDAKQARDLGAGPEQQIGHDHAGDRAGCPDQLGPGAGCTDQEDQSGAYAAEQIKGQEASSGPNTSSMSSPNTNRKSMLPNTCMKLPCRN